MLRVSDAYPARETVTLCCPGVSPGRLNGVTQLGSVRPSIWTSAPSGVELMVICPGITAAAKAWTLIFFLLFLLYLGVTETGDASRPAEICSGCACAGVSTGGCAGFQAGFGVASTGVAAAAGGSAALSSAEFSEWIR